MRTKNIENKIRSIAANRLSGKYNLAQYKEGGKCHGEYQKAFLHKKVCEEVVEFTNKHLNVPMCFIIGCGVQKDAHKTSAFEKGYKKFDADKVECVLQMGKAYNEFNGIKGKMSDVTWRLITRYYEKKSKSFDDFMSDLRNSQVLGKAAGQRGNYNALCRNLNMETTTQDN